MGDMFGNEGASCDLCIVHPPQEEIDTFKTGIEEVFNEYFISMARVVFFTQEDFDKRYRLADKFVLGIMKQCERKETHMSSAARVA